MRIQRTLSLALVAGALSACGGQTPASRPIQASGSHNVLTEAELQSAHDRTLYETVLRLRPTFLRSRQARTTSTAYPEPVHVFVDGSRAEGLETLRLLVPRNVKEVRFHEPHQANVKFGTGHNGGLIEIVLKE